jgi:REP element-mobilizing transposase RayT
MSTGYLITEQDRAYYLTFQVVDWIDVFTRKEYKDIIIENFKYCQKHRQLELFAYVIMSNHIHLLARSGEENMSGFIRDFKTYTSKTIVSAIETGNESRKEWMLKLFADYARKHNPEQKFQFWTHENHAEMIYSPAFVEQKIDYIHNNPVRAGYVARPWDYMYSSARNYADLESLIDVITLTRRIKTY